MSDNSLGIDMQACSAFSGLLDETILSVIDPYVNGQCNDNKADANQYIHIGNGANDIINLIKESVKQEKTNVTVDLATKPIIKEEDGLDDRVLNFLTEHNLVDEPFNQLDKFQLFEKVITIIQKTNNNICVKSGEYISSAQMRLLIVANQFLKNKCGSISSIHSYINKAVFIKSSNYTINEVTDHLRSENLDIRNKIDTISKDINTLNTKVTDHLKSADLDIRNEIDMISQDINTLNTKVTDHLKSENLDIRNKIDVIYNKIDIINQKIENSNQIHWKNRKEDTLNQKENDRVQNQKFLLALALSIGGLYIGNIWIATFPSLLLAISDYRTNT